MSPIAVGESAPPVPGLPTEGVSAVVFYKVTCPVCRMAAPVFEALSAAFPGRIVVVGQDPSDELERFGRDYGLSGPPVSDAPPYPLSDAYGVEVVPTLVLVGDGAVEDVVPAWDREGYNRVAARMAAAAGAAPVSVSDEADGLPAFRPG